MKTISDVIARLGGNSALAERLGISPSGVSEMKRRKSIPPRYWRSLLALADEISIPLTAEVLVALHADAPIRQEGAFEPHTCEQDGEAAQ